MTNKKDKSENKEIENKPPRPHARMFTQPSLTKQSFTPECSIVNIIQRYKATGEVPTGRPAQYGEQAGDFQQLHFAMAEAKSQFENIDPKLKEKYGSLEGVIEALNSTEGLRELDADGIIQLVEPITVGNEKNPDTDESMASQPKNDESTPEDPAEGGNA